MEYKPYSEEIDLQKHWLVIKRRWLPAVGIAGAVTSATAFAVSNLSPTYQATGKLLLKTDRTSSLTGLSADDQVGHITALTQRSEPVNTQAEVIRSLPIAQSTIKTLKLKGKDGKPLDPRKLLENLKVKPLTGTDALAVSYQSNDPNLAAKVVNTVIDKYIATNRESNREEAVAARSFIQAQLPTVEAAVQTAEENLRQFKERNSIVSLPEETTAAVAMMSKLEQQIVQAKADLGDITAQSSQFQQQLGMSPRQALNLTALAESTGVQEVLTQLQQVQSKLAVATTRYRDNHPTIASLQRQENVLSGLLQDRVQQIQGGASWSLGDLQTGKVRQDLTKDLVQTEVKRSGLEQQLQQLSSAYAAYQQRATTYPDLEKTQRELERRLKAAQQTYETLLASLQKIQVAENQKVGNAAVIEKASVPERPSGIDKRLLLAAGGAAGLLLAVGMAFLLDTIDRSVKTVREAKEVFGYTLLGIIPTHSKSSQPNSRVIVRDQPGSPISATYQMIQANLKFLSSDKKLKTIVISSSVPKEGKSEVAANLAAALAQVGRRTLLIDADLRHPSQHHIWGLNNTAGLSNLLVGQIEEYQAIQRAMDNLYVLPAGAIPPNPVPLLDSKRIATLLSSFSQVFDFIIFDTPPLAGTPDAAVLGNIADGVLLVVRPNVVNGASAAAAKEFLAQTHQNVLGMVINGVNVKSEPDSYFYYTNAQSEQLPPKQLVAADAAKSRI
jgi:capsular exopolysaccharide synthesis family protein